MSADEERVRKLIAEQAADWFVANRAGLSSAERGTYAAWLKASPAHVEEYLAVSVIARDLRSACAETEGSLDDLIARARLERDTSVQSFWRDLVSGFKDGSTRRWRTAAVTMGSLGVLSLGLLAWWNFRPHARAPVTEAAALHFETRHGEQQTHRLADGSVLHLNTDSAVTIRFSSQERRVALSAGEAIFEVAHEAVRAFRVSAGAAEVRAIGAQFDVRLERDSTVVTVMNGRVTVAPTTQERAANSRPERWPEFVELNAEQQLSVAEGQWPPARPAAVDVQRTTAWLHRQIIFDHESPDRVTSEADRDNDPRIAK